MKVLSPAKINIGLWITGRRDDGYHNIATVFHKIPLYDELIIEKSTDFSLKCLSCPNGKKNTIYRAYRSLTDFVGREIPVSVKVKKKIPLQGGLGGGSSNAGVFLNALNEMYALHISKSDLIKMGAGIGADVPFFLLTENSALGKGRGDILLPFNAELNGKMVIYRPGFGVPTAWAYSMIDALERYTDEHFAEDRLSSIKNNMEAGVINASIVENDFEFIVFERYPELKSIVEAEIKKGADFCRLCGSGSSVFCYYRGNRPLSVSLKEYD